MNTNHWSGAKRAEEVLAELKRAATEDGYVGCTTRGIAQRLDFSQATASRALTRLVETGAICVIQAGTRSSPTTYRVVRKPDQLLLRDDIARRAIA